MKKLAFFLIMTIVAVGLHAQETYRFRNDHPQGISIERSTANELKLHYSINEISLADIDNGEAKGQEIILKGSFGSFAAGLPNLPFENRYIAVPHGATVSIEVTEKGHKILNNIDLLPAAEVVENAAVGLPKLRKDMNVFGHDADFPSENVSIAQTTQIRGLDVVLLNITPFRYNPVRKTLEVVYDLDIDIRFEGGNGQFGEARYRNPDWDGILRNLVINSDMLPEAHYYDLINNAVEDREEGCEYLIVSPDDREILAWADTLKRFRTQQGILTKVVSTTECGGNTPEAIKGYIQNAYEHWAIPPATVTLFGGLMDTVAQDGSETMSGIPGFFLLFLNYDGTGQNYYYFSDNPYADMNGDSIPDLALSRMPAYSITDYKTEVLKTIKYETNPPTNPDYYHRPIITSGYEDNKWFLITSQAANGFYRKKLGKQPRNFYMMYEYSSSPIAFPDTAWSTGYNTPAVVDHFGPHGQDYIAQCPDTLNSWRSMFDYSYLIDALNQGSFLTLYRDHSGNEIWCCPWISIQDILRLTHNTDPTFLLSIGCHTGEFIEYYYFGSIHETPLIATWCNEQVGALGGIGASSVTHSHFNDMLTWGVLDYFWPSFMPGLGNETDPVYTRPVYGLVAGKLFLNQHVFMPNYWPTRITATHNVFHDLGEAYLSLNTEVPQPLAVEAGLFTDGQKKYTFKAEDGALVCLSHNDEILSVIQANGETQSIPLPNLPIGEHLQLTITKKNSIRFEQEVTVTSPDQPLVYTEHFQVISQNNGQLDAGEIVDIDLTLHNHSQVASDHGTLTLLCDSPYIKVEQGTAIYPSIDPEASFSLKKAFQIQIDNEVPDQTIVEFIVQFDENENTHQDHFRKNINAPCLRINPAIRFLTANGLPSTHIETEGNSSVVFSISNTGHSDIHDLCATLDVKAPFVTVETPSLAHQDLAADEELTLTYPLSTTTNAISGAWLQSQFQVQYGKNILQLDTLLQYGGIYENFETEEPNPFFKWISSGSHKWDYSNADAYVGQYCYMANAETTTSSLLKVQLKKPHVDHPSKISFYYKTGENDTLRYSAGNDQALLSSKEWRYAEVDYHSTIIMNWSYKLNDSTSVQARLDDMCFPPLHRAIAYAGDDMVVCNGTAFVLNNAYAYDYQSLQWTSDGDGTFDDNSSVHPVYTPGRQDLANGAVTLTLSAFDEDAVVSSTQIRFVDEISLGTITGDSIVNKFKEPLSHYAVEYQPGLQYHWQLEPADAGAIYDFGHEIDILWNLFSSDTEITLSVTTENGCVTTPSVKQINLVGYGNSEWIPVHFTLYPNPTDGKVNLCFDKALQGKTIVEVYNLLGEKLVVKHVSQLPQSGIIHLDLNHLAPGLYIIKSSAEHGSFSKKVSLR